MTTMRGSFKRVEHVVRTIRCEMEAPVEVKEMEIALTWVRQEFVRRNGREPNCDNDFWLEPMDEAVAFVFKVEEQNTI